MNEPLPPGTIPGDAARAADATRLARDGDGPNQAVVDAIFRAARTGIVIAALDGRRLRVNEAFCEMTGFTEAELLALDFRQHVHPEDLPRSLALRESLLAGERESCTTHRRFLRKDGTWLLANATTSMVRDADGSPSFTVVVIDDLSEQMRSAQVLADSEDRYRATFDRAGVGITHMDAEGRRLSVNRTFCEMLGYSEEAFLALPFDALMHPDEADAIRLARDKVLRGELKATTMERRYRCRDGRWIWGQVTTTVVERGGGRPAYTIAIMRDITARRIAEDALRASEERFRATFEQAPFAIAHSSPSGTWLRVNRRFVEMFGYRLDELAGVTWNDLNHPDEIAARERNVRQLASGEAETITREKRYLRRGGIEFWGQVTLSAVRDRDGGVDYMVTSIEDISERRRAADAMRDSEARFRSLIEFSSDWYWEQDEQLRFTVMSGGAVAARDLVPGDYLGRQLWDLPWLPGTDAAEWKAHRSQVERREPFRDLVLSRQAADGTLRHASISGEPVFAADGAFRGYRGVSSDVTNRVAFERRLHERDAENRLLAEIVAQSQDAIVTHDLDNRIVTWNAGATRLFGHARADAIGRNATELLADDPSPENVALHVERLRAGVSLTRRTRGCTADGRLLDIETSLSPLRDADGRLIGQITISRDLTDRIETEQALRESEARNRLLAGVVDQTTEAIVTKDLDNRVLTWNRGATALFGYSAEEAIGRNISTLVIPGADEERIAAAVADTRACRTHSRFEARRARNGRTFDVEVSYSPLYSADGEHIGEISIARDITSRLGAERALRASEARSRLLAAVVEQSAEAIIIKDLDNIILSWNAGAERMYGWTQAEAVGRNITLLVRPAASGADVARRIARLRRGEPEAWQTVSHRRDGTSIHVDVNVSPLFDENGRHIGEITMVRDITERQRAETALRATEARNRELALIVDQSYDAIITKDTTNRILTWNRGAERIFGWPAGEVLGRNFLALMKPEAEEAELRAAIDRIGERKAETWETVRTTKAGERIHVEVTVSPLFDDDGQHLGEISINRDITARVQAEEALRDHRLFLEQAQAVGGIGSWALSLADGRLTWSDETVRIFGLERGSFDGRPETFQSLVHPDDVERVRIANEQAVATRAPYTNEYRILRPDGTQRWIYEHAAIICDDQDRPLRVVGVAQDITERRAAQERIEFLATRDPLTELPNRLLLRDRITHGMASAARNGTQLALLFIDLDRFKTINDSLGHRVGDELLKQVAERLARCVRMEDTLARLGGDEFVVLLQGLGDSQVASQVARKVLKLLARPYLIEGHQLSTSCSIGISLYPTDGTDAQTLMKNADAAMYHAKERGRGNYQYFSADLHSRAVERLSIETALRRALERDEFELHYQPQVRMGDSKVVGMEALLRWNHPEEGLLAPGRFIRIAEESGLIVPLGEWALDAACARMRAWLDAGLKPPRLAVNVSVGQLSRSFVRSVGRILQAHRIDGAQLELEMTESLLMQHVDENVKLLQRLGDLGVQVALDDFGTGYSSLAYLKKFPIDALKIDRTFVRDIVEDPDDSAITAAVVSIGHHMQLRVVAEGVETAEQLAILQSMGCDEYQGYLFSRPLPVQGFEARFLAGDAAVAAAKAPGSRREQPPALPQS
jgi:diguanylate cyclase (GGDEF)-like protein/PAS domain S-box-containing protein